MDAISQEESKNVKMDEDEAKERAKEIKAYGDYVKKITPKRNLLLQMWKAFLVGGVFCLIGQIVMNLLSACGVESDAASVWCSIILVAISAILTGLSLYQKIANFGGAGALVPITGFANSVCAPAIEYRVEGQVFGIGVKIFTIAGPVILYGILVSWFLGLVYYLMKLY